jgi:hypothetical protein
MSVLENVDQHKSTMIQMQTRLNFALVLTFRIHPCRIQIGFCTGGILRCFVVASTYDGSSSNDDGIDIHNMDFIPYEAS